MQLLKPSNITIMAILILSIGTIFYHFEESWSWVDAFYFSVITLTTVGYGDLSPSTELSKIFTSFYVLSGIGIIFAFASSVFQSRIEKMSKTRIVKLTRKEKEPK